MSTNKEIKVTPRVWKAMRYAGDGYDTYGKQRDGKNYCDLEVAVALETELIAAAKEIKLLQKQNDKLLKELRAFARFGNSPGAGGGGTLDLYTQGQRVIEHNVRDIARKALKAYGPK
jgi:hypothetical protein